MFTDADFNQVYPLQRQAIAQQRVTMQMQQQLMSQMQHHRPSGIPQPLRKQMKGNGRR